MKATKKVLNSHLLLAVMTKAFRQAAVRRVKSAAHHIAMSSSNKVGLDQELRTVTGLTQQQLRFVHLLEYTAPELDEAVERELEDNPALEAGETVSTSVEVMPEGTVSSRNYDTSGSRVAADYTTERLSRRDYSDNSDNDYASWLPAEGENLYDSLERQLSERAMSEEDMQVARYIIGNLDSNGYLRRSLSQMIDDMAFGPGIDVSGAQAERVLAQVRSLDPPGIGAFDLQECLLLQLERMPSGRVRNNALRIVRDQFDAFTKKHTPRIAKALKLTPAQVTEAVDLIVRLNPKPGAALGGSSDSARAIVPDVIVDNDGGNLTITLNNRLPELRIDTTFEQAMRQLKTTAAERRNPKKTNVFITSRYNDARDFIRILRQRQQTMLDVVTAIVRIQREYFLTEDVYRLKPMLIKDITAMTGLDPSVISRATNNKYVATSWGVFPLRFFFSDTIGDDTDESGDGAVLTNRKMEAEIEAIVEAEDKKHPLSDEKIRLEMEKRGYDVSRRTVAKYRDRLGVPPARLRRSL